MDRAAKSAVHAEIYYIYQIYSYRIYYSWILYRSALRKHGTPYWLPVKKSPGNYSFATLFILFFSHPLVSTNIAMYINSVPITIFELDILKTFLDYHIVFTSTLYYY